MSKEQSLKKFKAKRVIPVVAVTAYTDYSTRDKALAVGMSDVLHKPVHIEDLKKVLDKYYF